MRCSCSKINRHGTGFLLFPKDERGSFLIGEQQKVVINPGKKEISFHARIRKQGSIGVYVPKELMRQHNLIGEQEVLLESVPGVVTGIEPTGRLYIPREVGKRYALAQDDVCYFRIQTEENIHETYCRIRTKKRAKGMEYYAFLNIHLAARSCIILDIKKLPKNKIFFEHKIDFRGLLSSFDFAEIEERCTILFQGHRVPVIINSSLNLEEIAHYLGCFFADGTKRGNDWGICASTFEQANYFKEMHAFLIRDHNIQFGLTITSRSLSIGQRQELLTTWQERTGTSIDSKKIYHHRSESEGFTNRNTFGTLVMKEHRQLVQHYYNALVKHLLSAIRQRKDASLAQKFICGVIEGDGCLNARGRGHIQIATNSKSLKF